jgi:DNA-binding CsgD family transcriptional regulator
MAHKNSIELQGVKNKLEQKNKDIINYALNMVQQKQFLKMIREELGVLYNRNKNLSELDRMISKISYLDDFDDEWERLKVHFDTVHSGFFSRLKEQFPTLTQTEMQHCSYIKLQLPTKEIARMLNIDPKSVQASRYRIKKKMNLDLNTDLREVIETF